MDVSKSGPAPNNGAPRVDDPICADFPDRRSTAIGALQRPDARSFGHRMNNGIVNFFETLDNREIAVIFGDF